MLNAIKNIYRQSAVPVVVTNLELNVVFANDTAQRLYPGCATLDGVRMMFPGTDDAGYLKTLSEGESVALGGGFDALSGAGLVLTPLTEDDVFRYILVHFVSGKRHGTAINPEGPTKALAAFSYQFRSPLSNIFAMLSVINQKLGQTNEDGLDPYLDEIAHNCYQMLRGCINFAEVMKITNKIEEPALQKLDLWQLLSGICESSSLLTRNVGIPLRRTVPSTPAYVFCDKNKLSIALVNILSNACRFTKEGNEIAVTGAISGGRAQIVIADKGLGIPAHLQTRVFEPFFSYDASGMPFAGIGLGATVAKQIICTHGGSIALNSTELSGTTVAVSLPLCQDGLGAIEFNTTAADYLVDRFSQVHIGLSDSCRPPRQ